ncbi:MAG: hypothetical protein COA79_09775 [Planctomycetota bacterium]|nr:MAG: hypothetical protein COA79_09775 [Planctomycetota bacterium]
MKKTILIFLINLVALTFLIAEEVEVDKKKKFEIKKIKLDTNKKQIVKPFKEIGYLVDIQLFFDKLKVDKKAILEMDRNRSAYLVFVNRRGVFSFLETEQNDSVLEIFEDGSLVELEGKEFLAGKLLEIDKINVSDKKPKFVIERYKKNFHGKKIKLSGVNMCQCSLKITPLKHNCKLGHLHHLQTKDDTIYHYIQPGKSSNMSFHGKAVDVEGLLFPGNFIAVTKRTLKAK